MARLRYNGLRGVVGVGGMDSTQTGLPVAPALTDSRGNLIPTISSPNYIPLFIVDPTTGNINEIVYLTGYTSGATLGLVTRGQEGTTGVAHSPGDLILHDLSAVDFGIVTSYTPSWVGATTNPTLNNGTLVGWYALIGQVCYFTFILTTGSTTNLGSGQYGFGFPTAAPPVQPGAVYGTLHNSTNPYPAVAVFSGGDTTFSPKAFSTTAGNPGINMTQTAPASWTTGAVWRFSGSYLWAF